MAEIRERTVAIYEKRKAMIVKKTYFFEVVVPLVYSSIESSLIEYQHAQKTSNAISLDAELDGELSEVEELEEE